MPKERKQKEILAKDCKCCKCGKKAVCFWPIIDLDIPEHPYCRKCVDKAKMEVLMKLHLEDLAPKSLTPHRKMKTFKGKVNIDGKEYSCEVKNGERFIDGKTIEEFMETLTPEQNLRAARVGKMALDDERKGIKPPKCKYQYFINEPL